MSCECGHPSSTICVFCFKPICPCCATLWKFTVCSRDCWDVSVVENRLLLGG